MNLWAFSTKRTARCELKPDSAESGVVEYESKGHGVYEEQSWRCLDQSAHSQVVSADILISRWVNYETSVLRQEAVRLSDRYVFSIALKTTRLNLVRGTHTVFAGTMPAGTVHVTGPCQSLVAIFMAPCDFIHIYVSDDYIRRRQSIVSLCTMQQMRDLSDLVIRDPLAETLARTLIEGGNAGDRFYADNIGQALVIRVLGMQTAQPSVNSLPIWRLKRVQDYVNGHFDQPLSLDDLAAVSGLSRMHFAAQFRAATGYQPHEYLLSRRIEYAKGLLLNSRVSIAEVALRVGFSAQSHFSTVFKRFVGQTPARWRRASAREQPVLDAGRRSLGQAPPDAGSLRETGARARVPRA
jgi:AraC family transcriptional regulator